MMSVNSLNIVILLITYNLALIYSYFPLCASLSRPQLTIGLSVLHNTFNTISLNSVLSTYPLVPL
jgi:hypothetical protein